jgi:ribosomal protein S30
MLSFIRGSTVVGLHKRTTIMRRPQPPLPPKSMMTPPRLREQEDFERRMKSGAEAKAAAEKARKIARRAFARISAKQPGVCVPHCRTPVFRIARGFRPGHGKFS